MTRPGGTAVRALATGAMLAVTVGACAPYQPGVRELLAGHAPTPVPESTPEVSYIEIGRRLLAAGEYETAIKAFMRSVRIEGVSAAAMTGAGVAAEQLGRVREARGYFEAAVELDPNSILARNNLGVALYKLGDYHNARAAFEAAFALSDGANEVAAQNLALVTHKIAAIEGEGPVHVDLGYEVVRTGSSVYSLTPSGERPRETPEAQGG